MTLESSASTVTSGTVAGMSLATKIALGALGSVIAVTGGTVAFQYFTPQQLSEDSQQSVSIQSDAAQSSRAAIDIAQSSQSDMPVAVPAVKMPPTKEEMGNMTLDVPIGCTYLVGEYGASPNTVKVAFNDGKAFVTGAELAVSLSIEDYAVVSNGNERGALVHFKCQYPRGTFQSFLTVYSPDMFVKGNLYAGSDEIANFVPATSGKSLFSDVSADGSSVYFSIPGIHLAEERLCTDCGRTSAKVTAHWDGQYLNLQDYSYEINGRTLPGLNEARVQEVIDAIAGGDYDSIRPMFLEGAWQDWDAQINPVASQKISLRTHTFNLNAHVKGCALIRDLENGSYVYHGNDGMTFNVPQSVGFEAGDYLCPIYQNNIGSDEVTAQSVFVVRPLDDGNIQVVAFNRYFG